MKVFELDRDVDRYRWLTMVDETDFKLAFELKGQPIAATWQAPAIKPIEDELNEGKPLSDFPTLGTIPTFSQRAVDALLDMLIENGELLPLRCEHGSFYAYNVTRVVDALDEGQSQLERYSTGRVMRVIRYEFQPQRVRGLYIFKVPQLAREFVTDLFVNRVISADLKGFAFKEVWASSDLVAP